ncbi:MAG: ATP-binding cassette domain-containing protein [Chloroflexota bacterium]
MFPQQKFRDSELANAPKLVGRWPSGHEFEAVLQQENFLVGRHYDADLVVPPSASFVSARHFEIQRTPVGCALVDLSSTNGTRLNNELITPLTAVSIKHGDIIRIGSEQSGNSIGLTFVDPTATTKTLTGFQTKLSETILVSVERITIGRDPSCDVVLPSPTVGRIHATVQKYDATHHYIKASDNSQIIVNGLSVKQAQLAAGDQVQIGNHLLTFDGQTLQQFDSHGYRLDVVNLHKDVKTKNGRLRILDSINFTIMPREFVALVGGSGAGKSTLLDALNGFRPAQGQVLINGQDLYQNYDAFRTQMGYVPQHDILPGNLTIEAALIYAAKLRLANDITPVERDHRITQALDTVGMNEPRLRQTRISRLSGGQRKRVSIAAELLADPKIFFLDEPASGLDPGLEKKLMYTLRKMADEGRTIVLITHATDNIVQTDHVAFLSQGKLIFFGPPREAQSFFSVEEFADIYDKIEHNGELWRQQFAHTNPAAYEEYVVARRNLPAQSPQRGQSRPSLLRNLRQGLYQLGVLSQRMFRLVISDPIALFVSLLVMPFVAVQQLLVFSSHELIGYEDVLANASRAAERFTENYLPALDAHSIVFTLSILAFLVGTFGGSQELLKERSIYLRERMVNLQLIPYMASKFVVFGGFAVVQVAIYLAILQLGLDLPTDGVAMPGMVEIGITLFLTILVGTATGLLISAASGNSTVAVYLVLIAVFFQYIFGGAIHNLRDKPIETQSYIAATRWATLAMGTTVDINNLADKTIVCGNKFELDTSNFAIDPATGAPQAGSLTLVESDESVCTNRAMATSELYLPYGETADELYEFWAILIAMTFGFGLAATLVVKRLDSKR